MQKFSSFSGVYLLAQAVAKALEAIHFFVQWAVYFLFPIADSGLLGHVNYMTQNNQLNHNVGVWSFLPTRVTRELLTNVTMTHIINVTHVTHDPRDPCYTHDTVTHVTHVTHVANVTHVTNVAHDPRDSCSP